MYVYYPKIEFIKFSQINHRFDCKYHTFFQFNTCIFFSVVKNIWTFMKPAQRKVCYEDPNLSSPCHSDHGFPVVWDEAEFPCMISEPMCQKGGSNAQARKEDERKSEGGIQAPRLRGFQGPGEEFGDTDPVLSMSC